MKRFRVVKRQCAWKVLDTRERIYIWESLSLKAAREYADSQNTKEFLRTAPIISIESLSDYRARIARQGNE